MQICSAKELNIKQLGIFSDNVKDIPFCNHSEVILGQENKLKQNLGIKDLNYFGRVVKKINQKNKVVLSIAAMALCLIVIGIPAVACWAIKSVIVIRHDRAVNLAIKALDLKVDQINEQGKIFEKLESSFINTPNLIIDDINSEILPSQMNHYIMKGEIEGRHFIAIKLLSIKNNEKFVVTYCQKENSSEWEVRSNSEAFNLYFLECEGTAIDKLALIKNRMDNKYEPSK